MFDNDLFESALRDNSVEKLKKVAKSDLHSHAGRGGTISYISNWANVKILPPQNKFNSLTEMNEWLNANVKCYCSGIDGYIKRIEAAFVQAHMDSIHVLAMSYGVDEISLLGGMKEFVQIMNDLHYKYACNTKFFPDLAIGYSKDEENMLDEILSFNWFKGIDIVNYAENYTIKELKKICDKAKKYGLLLKAHIGEFDNPDSVMRYAEELELDEIQHGIAAAKSPQVMHWLEKHKIQLNICPTSNVMLQICENYRDHPIRVLFDYGIPMSINTDDLLIFNSSVSEEYLHLFNSGIMKINELNFIRKNGLNHNYT